MTAGPLEIRQDYRWPGHGKRERRMRAARLGCVTEGDPALFCASGQWLRAIIQCPCGYLGQSACCRPRGGELKDDSGCRRRETVFV